MGILNTVLPATSSIIAHSGQPGVVRADQSAQQAVANAVVTGQAAVVSLSQKSPRRVASHGESRNVDASFEKQQIKEEVEKKEEVQRTTTGKSVDVSA
jgi:hypothetical protein